MKTAMNSDKFKELKKKGGPLDFSNENDKGSEIELKNIVIGNIEGHYEDPSNGFHYEIKNGSIVCKKGVLIYSNNGPKLSFIFEEFDLYNGNDNKIRSYKGIDYDKIKGTNLKTGFKLNNPNFFILNLDYSSKNKVIRDNNKEIIITKFSINLPNGNKLTYNDGVLGGDENLLDRTMFIGGEKTEKFGKKTLSTIEGNLGKVDSILKK